MQCPKCALYHPARYERCVSCSTKLVPDGEPAKQTPAVSTKHSRGGSDSRGNRNEDPRGRSNEPRNNGRSTSSIDERNGGYGETDYEGEDAFANGRGSSAGRYPGAGNAGYGAQQTYGAGGGLTGSAAHESDDAEDDGPEERSTRRGGERRRRSGLPTALGVAIAGFILCASAGGTYFYLTKPPENERLLQDGQKQISLGQFAFALKTLTEARKARPNDPRILLTLARAYVGVDQVDKAWECITQAQSLGSGVASDPQLTSDLANYYRQHNQYTRAIELLRPLAQQNIPGKKAELADLDAAWGDDAMRDGDMKQAMRAWEEVRQLHEGSRFGEADTRLASIYQKIAEQMGSKGDNDEALRYYNKLNATSPSANSYERAAELYQKQGDLDLAIDQMNHAIKQGGDTQTLNRKLASMMATRGKELIDKGEVDSGYGYLQKAQSLDARIRVPSTTVRNVHVTTDPTTGFVRFSAEVWNPGPADLLSVTVRGELYDTKTSKVLWTKDQHVVDEFVPPLGLHETRGFELISGVPASDPSVTDFRVYLNGSLYRSYPLTARHGGAASSAGVTSSSGATSKPAGNAPFGGIFSRQPAGTPVPDASTTGGAGAVQMAPRIQPPVQADTNPPAAPPIHSDSYPGATPGSTGPSPEERTLKDLD